MKTKIFTLVLSMALFSTYAFAQDCATATPPVVGNVCTFNSNGNFTVPAGYSVNITVTAWGGGGGGSRGGGGGGAYATNMYSNIPAGSYAITVGQGGAPGTAGTFSSYTFPAGTVTAGGGAPGGAINIAAAAGGALAGPSGTGSNAGGNGGPTDGNGGGGGGGSGPGATAGVAGTNGSPGAGGSVGGGAGGTNPNPGTNGSAPGGGGGGRGTSGSPGGTGAAGRVIVEVTAVFPVELLSFSGKATPSAIQLNWETSTELNNEKFVVERSNDGRTFQMIGEELGQGTTQQTVSYEFMDKAPVTGINYYRLKQMDYDGQFAYSPVTAITFTRKGGISIYPTATNGMVNIVTEEEGNAQVKVFHINGSLMQQEAFNSNTLPLDLSSLPNGTYLIVVETSTQTHQERIFKY